MAAILDTDLTKYIKSMAESAKIAQQSLASGTTPMVISEFNFKANIAGQTTVSSTRGTTLRIARLSLREQVMTQYKGEWGLALECRIIAAV